MGAKIPAIVLPVTAMIIDLTIILIDMLDRLVDGSGDQVGHRLGKLDLMGSTPPPSPSQWGRKSQQSSPR